MERGANAESLKAVNVEDFVKPGEIQLVPDDFMGEDDAAYYTPDRVIQIRESRKDNPGDVTHELFHKISRTSNPEARVWLDQNLGFENAAKMEEGLTEMGSIIATKLARDPGYYDTLKGLDDENFEFQVTEDARDGALKEKAYAPHVQRVSGRLIRIVKDNLGVSRCEAFVKVSADYQNGNFQGIVEKAGGVQTVNELMEDLPQAVSHSDNFGIGVTKMAA